MRPALNRHPCPNRRRLLARLAAALSTVALPHLVVADVPPSEPVSFGVFPYLPALEIGRQFGPMASALSATLGRPVGLQTKSGFPAFRAALHEARYDIALLHPFLYSDIVQVQDYRPLARLEDDLAGVVVAPPDLQIASFADLRGDTLAVPPALSGVAQLVELELRQAGLDGPDGVRLAHYRTKTACVHAILTGQATACVIPTFFLGQLAAAAAVPLEAKFATKSVPGILFVGHGRLGDAVLDHLQRALVGWNGTADGRRLLAGLGWSGLARVGPGDYDTAELQLLAD